MFEELGKFLKGIGHPFVHVDYQSNGVLATLTIGEDRKQTVKIADHPWADDDAPVIRVQSRVCAITDPQTVLILLQANAHAELGGFVMDTSSEPNAVDVVYSVLRDALDFPALAVVVQHVANLADKYEHQLTGCDEF